MRLCVIRLGLDIGKARIGVAISYSVIASNYETIYCKSWTKDTNYIAEIAKKVEAEQIIVGLPLNMDGSQSEMCDYAKKFCEMLSTKISSKIIFVDERLSSVSAEEIMHQCKTKTAKKKGLIDQIAAMVILQTYLDKQNEGV